MTERSEWYQKGYERGHQFGDGWEQGFSIEDAEDLDDAASEAFENEENDRQFSPFEFLAKEINDLEEGDSEDAWEDFEEGVGQGVKDALSKRFPGL